MKMIYALMLFFGSVLLLACDNENDPAPPANVKVFVTSLSYDGNMPGLDSADTFCTTAATGAGLTGTWTAWLSDNINNIDAADRIFTGGAPYELINGTVIAANFTDLTDGMLDHPINIDESGNAVPQNFQTWTSTSVDGFNLGGSCQAWTTVDPTQYARIGYADKADALWTDAGGGNPCDSFNRLYCFADAVSN